MTRALLAAAVVMATLAPAASSAREAPQQLARPPAVTIEYGYVRSLARAGGTYRLRFDPALWLSGETANRAAREDGVIAAGEAVPNDYYIRNESLQTLMYLVPPTARVTIVTLRGGGPRSTRISVAQLATLTRRRSIGIRPYGRGLGYWARIRGDRVLQLDQQYQP